MVDGNGKRSSRSVQALKSRGTVIDIPSEQRPALRESLERREGSFRGVNEEIRRVDQALRDRP